jgi:CubicO group peptidase (beta-lactamase class C family)
MFLLATLFVIGALAPRLAEAHNGTLGLCWPLTGITLDGDLGDWPADLPRYPIAAKGEGAEPSGPADLAAWFRLGYNIDENALYVAVEVEDDSILRDPPAGVTPFYNTQDGCEIYVDLHRLREPQPPIQFYLWGRRTGTPSAPDSGAFQVVAASLSDRIWYEWRVDLSRLSNGRLRLRPGQSLGFDVAVEDVDADSSASWTSWSPGTGKWNNGEVIADLVLVERPSRPGSLRGRLAWKTESADAAGRPLPRRVRIRSLEEEALWVQVAVDSAGQYEIRLPEGHYEISAVDAIDIRVAEGPRVEARLVGDGQVEAELLRAVAIPEPRLAGEEGMLTSRQPFDPAQVDRFVRTYMEYLKIPGLSLALVKDGAIVYRRGFGVKNIATGEKVDESTLFEAASMTKPVFAYAVHRLVDQGVLDLDTPLYTYLSYPDAAHDERYKLITARMVLSHTTGFPNWRPGPKLEIGFTPGTQFGYSGEGFEYLKAVVGHLTGKDPEQIVQEEVFAPLGMGNAYLSWRPQMEAQAATGHSGQNNTPSPKWKPEKPLMAASLHVDAGTYAQFLVALIEGTGLSAARLEDMLRPHSKTPAEQGDGNPWASGLGLFITQSPCGTIHGHGGRNDGFFTSQSAVYRDRKVGYAFLTNSDQGERFDKALRAFLIEGTSTCGSAGVQSAGATY